MKPVCPSPSRPLARATPLRIARHPAALSVLAAAAAIPLAFAPNGADAEDAPAVSAVAADPASVGHGTDHLFAGATHRLEWILRSEAEHAGTLRLSLYRVLSSTVVPIEENAAITGEITLEPGAPLVVGYDFAVPEAGAQTTYLAKLAIERGEQATVIATRRLVALPPDFLSQFRGFEIRVCGFEDDAASHRRYFESCGWPVSADEASAPASATEIVVSAPRTTPTPATSAPGADAGVLVVREGLGLLQAAPQVVIARQLDAKTQLRIALPLDLWVSLPKSATAQAAFASILDDALAAAAVESAGRGD